jgi:hypothetical protein
LRFEVRAETYATFREALKALRRDSEGALDDDSTLLLLARRVFGAPDDSGRANYTVHVSRCDECGRAHQLGNGVEVPIEPEIADMALCDAFEVRSANPSDAHVGARRPDDVGAARGRQSIPPGVRRTVLLRDRGRCAVPGCRHATFVDVHHVRSRAEGGGHEPDNLVVLCGAHHRAVHRGALRIEAVVGAGFRFLHADGSPYGSAGALDSECTRCVRALSNLGFSERLARRAVTMARAKLPRLATTEALLRAALAVAGGPVNPGSDTRPT